MSDTQDQAISDDQELAKVLQGMQQQNHSMATSDPEAKPTAEGSQTSSNMQYEEAPTPSGKKGVITPLSDLTGSTPADTPVEPSHASPPSPSSATAPAAAPAASTAVSPALEALKKEALEELRPLAARLDLPAKEKFDTMLLIIRSTDDQDLLTAAHEAAKAIEDDMERAEALLDIVKEIDYFSSQK